MIERKCRSTLGQFIRLRRKNLRLTQGELAHKVGVTRQYVSQLEICGPVHPITNLTSSHRIPKLAKALRLNITGLKEILPHRNIKRPRGSGKLRSFLARSRFRRGLTMKELSELTSITIGQIFCLEHIALAHTASQVEALKRIEKALKINVPEQLVKSPIS